MTTACLICAASPLLPVLSLGDMPLTAAFTPADCLTLEDRFPLEVAFCPACSLVQLNHNGAGCFLCRSRSRCWWGRCGVSELWVRGLNLHPA